MTVTATRPKPAWRRPREERMQQITVPRMIRNRIGILLFNNFVTWVPSHHFRQGVLRAFGATIGRKTSILRGASILDIEGLTIGDNCSIGFRVMLDARAGITIGDNVVIASDVHIIGGHHDVNDPEFKAVPRSVTIDDYVWIASRSTLLGGTRLGRGVVVSACSMAHGTVPPLQIISGVPAKKIATRDAEALQYHPFYRPLFY